MMITPLVAHCVVAGDHRVNGLQRRTCAWLNDDQSRHTCARRANGLLTGLREERSWNDRDQAILALSE